MTFYPESQEGCRINLPAGRQVRTGQVDVECHCEGAKRLKQSFRHLKIASSSLKSAPPCQPINSHGRRARNDTMNKRRDFFYQLNKYSPRQLQRLDNPNPIEHTLVKNNRRYKNNERNMRILLIDQDKDLCRRTKTAFIKNCRS